MTSAPAITPLKFELRFRRAAHTVSLRRVPASVEPLAGMNQYEFSAEPDADKTKALPDAPPLWEPLTGDHKTVTERADELNLAQWAKGYMYYFFYPEIAGSQTTYDPEHCAKCAYWYGQTESDRAA